MRSRNFFDDAGTTSLTERNAIDDKTEIIFGNRKHSVEKLVANCESCSEESHQDIWDSILKEGGDRTESLSLLISLLGGTEELDKLLGIENNPQKKNSPPSGEEDPELDYCKTLKEIFPDDDDAGEKPKRT